MTQNLILFFTVFYVLEWLFRVEFLFLAVILYFLNKGELHLNLAVVSVFIEPVDDAARGALSGLTHMGAVHAFGKVTDGHQVTVLGEAPAVTVDMIGASVAPQP